MKQIFFIQSAFLTAFVLGGLGAAACSSTSEIDGRPCPCADGYTCCETNHVCLKTGETCPSIGGDAGDAGVGAANSDSGGERAHAGDGSTPTSVDGSPGSSSCVFVVGAADAGLAICTEPDGGGVDFGDAGASSCLPLGSVSGTFTPSYHPPSGLHQGRCTDEQIKKFESACLGAAANPAECNSFLATLDGKACAECILTRPSAPALGPLLDYSSQGYVQLNAAGCVAMLEPCNLACAKSLDATRQCEDVACNGCRGDVAACDRTADECACRSFAEQASCGALLTGPDHPASACFSSDFHSGYAVLAPLFCGK